MVRPKYLVKAFSGPRILPAGTAEEWMNEQAANDYEFKQMVAVTHGDSGNAYQIVVVMKDLQP